MIYKPKGKGSRAWWLQGIQKFGQTSKLNISKELHAGQQDVSWAIHDLISEHYVRMLGADGQGKRPKFELTELGEGYLRRNQDELEGVGQTATPLGVVYTWKRVLGGGVKYYADGQHIAAALVPEAELARIRQELNAGKFGSDVEHQAEHEYHEGDVYTWKQPIAGPCQYFLNGEFVLQTKVPPDEMNRMLAEQGSPLLSTQESNSYRVKVLESGRRVYFRNKRLIPRTEVPESQLEFLDNWTPPKEGDPRLKPSKRPKNPDDLDDDELGDEPGRSIPDPKVSNPRPLDRVVNAAIDLGESIENHNANKRQAAADSAFTRRDKAIAAAPKSTPVAIQESADKGILDGNKESELAPLLTPQLAPEPVNAAPAAREMFEQPGVADQMRQAINEILFEKYAHTLTAKEVLEHLESKV